MSVIHGSNGVVTVDGGAVAEVQNFSYDENAPVEEVTAMGDSAASYVASSTKRGTGTIECLFDPANATGQGALTPGASVALVLRPNGTGVGKVEHTGTVIVQDRNIAPAKDGIVPISFTYMGVLTEATQ